MPKRLLLSLLVPASVLPTVLRGMSDCPTQKYAAPSREAAQMVREDRVWKYYSAHNGHEYNDEDIRLNVRFDGTAEFDGMDYLGCRAWRDGDEYSLDRSLLIAWMREENGKVYVRYVPGEEATALSRHVDLLATAPLFSSWRDNGETEGEILLYDFVTMPGDDTADGDCLAIDDAGVETIGGKELMYRHTPTWGYGYYDGIGDRVGLVPFPGSYPQCYCNCQYMLQEVCDAEGNVVAGFDTTGVGASGVSDWMTHSGGMLRFSVAPSAVIAVYDLAGSKVAEVHASEGSVSLPDSSFVPGVYVVSCEGHAAKIVIR